MNDVWLPDSCKKSFVSVKRIPQSGKFSSAFDISVQNKICYAFISYNNTLITFQIQKYIPHHVIFQIYFWGWIKAKENAKPPINRIISANI